MSRQFSQQPLKSTSSSDSRNHNSVTLNSDSGHQTRMADGETSGSLSAVSSSSSQNSSVSIDTSLSPNEDQLTPGIAGNTSNLYQQLIESSDLVKELDDIEAISQQISQHAEVLYQNWKSNSQAKQTSVRSSSSSNSSTGNDSLQKVSSSSTTYGAGVGFPKRSILENGVTKNDNGFNPSHQSSLGNNHQQQQQQLQLQPPSSLTTTLAATGQKLSPLSSPTATLTSPSFVNKTLPKSEQQKIDLMPPSEVNGHLKDLVNSFVSTDRAKQAARQTISSTIANQMNKRNHFRSPSPTTSTSTTSSPFSSRGVSPLRSPMLVQPPPPERRLMDAFPTNASIMNSVHTKMPPMFNNEGQQNKKAEHHHLHGHSVSQPDVSSNDQSQPKTTNFVTSSSSLTEAVKIPIICIPIQHQPNTSSDSGSGSVEQQAIQNTLKSPTILCTALSNPTTTVVNTQPSVTGGVSVPGYSEMKTVTGFGGRPTSIPTLHAAHVETMKKRFEEAKERINAMHQRAAAGQPFPFLSPLGVPTVDPFGDELDFFSRIRSRPQRPLIAPPHPELTPQQKQHISERSSAAVAATAEIIQNQPPKRFGGSVADRVMLFERCPIINNDSKETRSSLVGEKRVMASTDSSAPVNMTAIPGAHNMTPPWKILHQERVGKLQTPRTKGTYDCINRHGRDIPITVATLSSSPLFPSLSLIPSTASSMTPTSSVSASTTMASTGALTVTCSSSNGGNVLAISSPTAPVFSSPLFIQNSKPSSASTSSVSLLSRVSRPPSIIVTGKEKVLPKFHFPLGNPSNSPSGDLTKFADEFRKHKNSCVSGEELGQILMACGYPLYWKGVLFSAAGGDKTGLLSYVAFSDFWRKMCLTHYDEAAQLMHILTFKNQRRNLLAPEDFVPLVQDVVDTHPGLGFLKEATEFHSRYVHTVIARIFFIVNRSWSGFITLSELRRSNLLSTLRLLQKEDDVNQITDFFSYEHFYVIYCKFWELDKDHDLFIDREDLARHNDHAISARMIDRIFSGAVTRGAAQQEGKMSYTEFVWFLLAEEDKRAATSIEYWFRCMDLDGDGFLSMYELEYFYEEQLQRMEQLGIETLPFEDCLCQMLDMIMPKKCNVISLQDMKKCRMTPIFFDTFFNLEKYLDHEQRDPFASQRDVDEEGNEMSDWDRFAAEEYELLVAEEGNVEGVEEMCYEDDPDGNAEMQLEQALDENDIVYHDTLITAKS